MKKLLYIAAAALVAVILVAGAFAYELRQRDSLHGTTLTLLNFDAIVTADFTELILNFRLLNNRIGATRIDNVPYVIYRDGKKVADNTLTNILLPNKGDTIVVVERILNPPITVKDTLDMRSGIGTWTLEGSYPDKIFGIIDAQIPFKIPLDVAKLRAEQGSVNA